MKHKLIIIIIALSLACITWIAVANRTLRNDISELRGENKRLQTFIRTLHQRNDSLNNALLQRNAQIASGTATLDSLKHSLQQLNKKNIIYIYEDYSTVTPLNLDSDISFLSRFIGAADRVAR